MDNLFAKTTRFCTSPVSGRYPGYKFSVWFYRKSASSSHAKTHSDVMRQTVRDTCLPLRGQHTLAKTPASCFPFNCEQESVHGHQSNMIVRPSSV